MEVDHTLQTVLQEICNTVENKNLLEEKVMELNSLFEVLKPEESGKHIIFCGKKQIFAIEVCFLSKINDTLFYTELIKTYIESPVQVVIKQLLVKQKIESF